MHAKGDALDEGDLSAPAGGRRQEGKARWHDDCAVLTSIGSRPLDSSSPRCPALPCIIQIKPIYLPLPSPPPASPTWHDDCALMTSIRFRPLNPSRP